MSVAYCIIAHGHQQLTRRLIDRILNDDRSGHVLLHYDSRQGPLPLEGPVPDRTHLLRERPIYWGGFELVALQMEMLALALQQGHSYAVFLSGQDYPVCNLGSLEEELSGYDVWADMERIIREDGTCVSVEGRRRYLYQWVRLTAAEPATWLKKLNRLAIRAHVLTISNFDWPGPRFVSFYQLDKQLWWGARSKGPGVPIYRGSQWMNLSRAAMEAICSAPPSLMSYFRRTPVPDEACFQTILANSPGLRSAPGNNRFIRFRETPSHPDILTINELDELRSSGAHFARKFDPDVDAEVLDHLDELAVPKRLEG